MQLPHENFYTKWDSNSLGVKSLKRKREERLFAHIRIILILHCGNEFFKQVLSFRFKLDDKVPTYESTIKSFFLGTVRITFFGTWSLFKKDLMDCSIILDGYLLFFKISLDFSTSKWNEV